MSKNFVEEPFCASENFGDRKMLGIREGASRFFVENFLSHSAENFRRGILHRFITSNYQKNFMPMRGTSRFSIENLLSHSTEKHRWRTFCVSVKVWYRKILWIGRGRRGRRGRREGVSRFSVKIFLSHSAENFRIWTFLCCVSENSRWPKGLWKGG